MSRPTAKKADTKAAAMATVTVTVMVTVRWKERRVRIQKSRKKNVFQLQDMFSQSTQDIITVAIHR